MLVAAKCPNCGANLKVDSTQEAGICNFCNTAFITEKAVNNYNITNITNNNIKTDKVEISSLNISPYDAMNEYNKGNYKKALSLFNKIEAVKTLDDAHKIKQKICISKCDENQSNVNLNEINSFKFRDWFMKIIIFITLFISIILFVVAYVKYDNWSIESVELTKNYQIQKDKPIYFVVQREHYYHNYENYYFQDGKFFMKSKMLSEEQFEIIYDFPSKFKLSKPLCVTGITIIAIDLILFILNKLYKRKFKKDYFQMLLNNNYLPLLLIYEKMYDGKTTKIELNKELNRLFYNLYWFGKPYLLISKSGEPIC